MRISTRRNPVKKDEENQIPTILITISDNGTGIEKDDLKNIFDPFFSTKDFGTGLGLPISLGIVENHGGHLRISSIKDRGSTVRIELPVE